MLGESTGQSLGGGKKVYILHHQFFFFILIQALPIIIPRKPKGLQIRPSSQTSIVLSGLHFAFSFKVLTHLVKLSNPDFKQNRLVLQMLAELHNWPCDAGLKLGKLVAKLKRKIDTSDKLEKNFMLLLRETCSCLFVVCCVGVCRSVEKVLRKGEGIILLKFVIRCSSSEQNHLHISKQQFYLC